MKNITKENGHGLLAKEDRPDYFESLSADPFFRDFFGPRGFWPFPNWARQFPEKKTFAFDLDMYKADGQYVVECALPGFKKDDIHVEVTGHRLTISAEAKKETEDKKAQYFCREREFGTYYRTVDFAEPIDFKKMSAKYEDGILKLIVPIPTSEATNRIPIGS